MRVIFATLLSMGITYGQDLLAEEARDMRQITTATLAAATPEVGGSDVSSKRASVVIDEIIVTAQRREQRLQDVPISISVLDSQVLDGSSAPNLNDMLSRVPGVALDTSIYGTGSASLTMRGVAAGSAFFTGSTPVGYYLDSVPFAFVKSAFVPDANPYDLERVEILRGPQGTLYGAGSLNGVVRVLTTNANLKEFELKSRLSYSSTESGGENYRGDAALNVPLVPGKLAARVVAGYQGLGGWIDKPNKADANDGTTQNLRLKLNSAPTDQLAIGLSAWISRSDFDASNFSPDGKTYPSMIEEPRATDFDAYSFNIDYQFPHVFLSSATSYIDYLDEVHNDTGAQGGAPGVFHLRFPARTFSQEINVSSSRAGSWRWSAGGIYRDSEDSLFGYRPGYLAPEEQVFQSKSYAVFGEITRLLADGRVELTGGLRYFEDQVQERQDSSLLGRPLGAYADNTFDALTPRLVFTWHANEQLTTYASYAEGFRSGAAQNPLILAFAPLPAVEPDKLKNYELGAKGALFDGALAFDSAIYFMDWQDVQQSLNIPTGAFSLLAVVNGASASGLGADVGLTASFASGLELGLNASWNDLSFDSNVFSGGVLLFNEDQRLNNSPEWTAGGTLAYGFRMGGGGWSGRLAGSVGYTSERSITQLVGRSRIVRSGDHMLVGGTSFSLDSPSDWSVALFIDNVGNEQGAVAPLAGTNGISRIRPRTIGLQFEFRR